MDVSATIGVGAVGNAWTVDSAGGGIVEAGAAVVVAPAGAAVVLGTTVVVGATVVVETTVVVGASVVVVVGATVVVVVVTETAESVIFHAHDSVGACTAMPAAVLPIPTPIHVETKHARSLMDVSPTAVGDVRRLHVVPSQTPT
jgi:hypothetical protein